MDKIGLLWWTVFCRLLGGGDEVLLPDFFGLISRLFDEEVEKEENKTRVFGGTGQYILEIGRA